VGLESVKNLIIYKEQKVGVLKYKTLAAKTTTFTIAGKSPPIPAPFTLVPIYSIGKGPSSADKPPS